MRDRALKGSGLTGLIVYNLMVHIQLHIGPVILIQSNIFIYIVYLVNFHW